jgi:hypothetical protein
MTAALNRKMFITISNCNIAFTGAALVLAPITGSFSSRADSNIAACHGTLGSASDGADVQMDGNIVPL